ncbi:HNH endonuclease signature motif containing protein [Deltaproteobacteria bacterium TL4]
MGLDERYHKEWAYISRYVRECFNFHCAKCGEECLDYNLPEKRLQVHHIDECPQNNEIENLIPLCAPCHLQIESEARLHAPYHKQQCEMFENDTYMTRMKQMRKEALEEFGNPQHSSPSKISTEDYELQEINDEINDYYTR